jgi:putative PIN family toxin of toxin-antitoxin system
VRVFLDTNVLVSAFATRGLCAEVLELVLLDHELIVGRNVLRELDKALRGKLKLAPERAKELVDFIADEATSTIESSDPVSANIDIADARVLGEALAGQADCFVTGDTALLRVGVVSQVRIVAPRDFWEMLATGGDRI